MNEFNRSFGLSDETDINRYGWIQSATPTSDSAQSSFGLSRNSGAQITLSDQRNDDAKREGADCRNFGDGVIFDQSQLDAGRFFATHSCWLVQGALQQYVDSLFETMFSTMSRGSVLPVAVKYMFDFLDDLALQNGILDPHVVHTWKSNRCVVVYGWLFLTLRFRALQFGPKKFRFDSIRQSDKFAACTQIVSWE